MPEIDPITREEKLWSGEDIEPITREEMYIKHIYDKTQTIPSKPITRKEMLLEKAGEGGGSDVTIKQLSVTANGAYSEEKTAYSPVIVNVPKTPLSKLTVTENSTYTAPTGTGYDEVAVDVPLPSNAYLLKDIPNTPIDIATFTDGSDLPMPKLEVAIEPQQGGSGDPSPDNIRPLSGWDECNVNVNGVNIWDEEWEQGGIRTSNGQDISLNAIRSKGYSPCKPSTAYYAKFTNDGYVFWYDADKNYISNFYSEASTRVIQSPNNAYWFRIRKDGITTYNNDISINYPSTDTEYHAYNGQTYNIQFTDGDNPLTVYGGSLDVVSGKLVVDRVFNTFTELPSQYDNVGNDIVCAFIEPNNMKVNSREDGLSNYFSPTVTIIRQNNPWKVCFGINNRRIYFTFDPEVIGGNTLENINNYVATNPIQVVYPLATPITYQLTPTQVKSLLGVNNIWADTGNVIDANYFSKEA